MLKPESADLLTQKSLTESIANIKETQRLIKKIKETKPRSFLDRSGSSDTRSTEQLSHLAEELDQLNEQLDALKKTHKFNSDYSLLNQSDTLTHTGATTTVMSTLLRQIEKEHPQLLAAIITLNRWEGSQDSDYLLNMLSLKNNLMQPLRKLIEDAKKITASITSTLNAVIITKTEKTELFAQLISILQGFTSLQILPELIHHPKNAVIIERQRLSNGAKIFPALETKLKKNMISFMEIKWYVRAYIFCIFPPGNEEERQEESNRIKQAIEEWIREEKKKPQGQYAIPTQEAEEISEILSQTVPPTSADELFQTIGKHRIITSDEAVDRQEFEKRLRLLTDDNNQMNKTIDDAREKITALTTEIEREEDHCRKYYTRLKENLSLSLSSQYQETIQKLDDDFKSTQEEIESTIKDLDSIMQEATSRDQSGTLTLAENLRKKRGEKKKLNQKYESDKEKTQSEFEQKRDSELQGIKIQEEMDINAIQTAKIIVNFTTTQIEQRAFSKYFITHLSNILTEVRSEMLVHHSTQSEMRLRIEQSTRELGERLKTAIRNNKNPNTQFDQTLLVALHTLGQRTHPEANLAEEAEDGYNEEKAEQEETPLTSMQIIERLFNTLHDRINEIEKGNIEKININKNQILDLTQALLNKLQAESSKEKTIYAQTLKLAYSECSKHPISTVLSIIIQHIMISTHDPKLDTHINQLYECFFGNQTQAEQNIDIINQLNTLKATFRQGPHSIIHTLPTVYTVLRIPTDPPEKTQEESNQQKAELTLSLFNSAKIESTYNGIDIAWEAQTEHPSLSSSIENWIVSEAIIMCGQAVYDKGGPGLYKKEYGDIEKRNRKTGEQQLLSVVADRCERYRRPATQERIHEALRLWRTNPTIKRLYHEYTEQKKAIAKLRNDPKKLYESTIPSMSLIPQITAIIENPDNPEAHRYLRPPVHQLVYTTIEHQEHLLATMTTLLKSINTGTKIEKTVAIKCLATQLEEHQKIIQSLLKGIKAKDLEVFQVVFYSCRHALRITGPLVNQTITAHPFSNQIAPPLLVKQLSELRVDSQEHHSQREHIKKLAQETVQKRTDQRNYQTLQNKIVRIIQGLDQYQDMNPGLTETELLNLSDIMGSGDFTSLELEKESILESIYWSQAERISSASSYIRTVENFIDETSGSKDAGQQRASEQETKVKFTELLNELFNFNRRRFIPYDYRIFDCFVRCIEETNDKTEKAYVKLRDTLESEQIDELMKTIVSSMVRDEDVPRFIQGKLGEEPFATQIKRKAIFKIFGYNKEGIFQEKMDELQKEIESIQAKATIDALTVSMFYKLGKLIGYRKIYDTVFHYLAIQQIEKKIEMALNHSPQNPHSIQVLTTSPVKIIITETQKTRQGENIEIHEKMSDHDIQERLSQIQSTTTIKLSSNSEAGRIINLLSQLTTEANVHLEFKPIRPSKIADWKVIIDALENKEASRYPQNFTWSFEGSTIAPIIKKSDDIQILCSKSPELAQLITCQTRADLLIAALNGEKESVTFQGNKITTTASIPPEKEFITKRLQNPKNFRSKDLKSYFTQPPSYRAKDIVWTSEYQQVNIKLADEGNQLIIKGLLENTSSQEIVEAINQLVSEKKLPEITQAWSESAHEKACIVVEIDESWYSEIVQSAEKKSHTTAELTSTQTQQVLTQKELTKKTSKVIEQLYHLTKSKKDDRSLLRQIRWYSLPKEITDKNPFTKNTIPSRHTKHIETKEDPNRRKHRAATTPLLEDARRQHPLRQYTLELFYQYLSTKEKAEQASLEREFRKLLDWSQALSEICRSTDKAADQTYLVSHIRKVAYELSVRDPSSILFLWPFLVNTLPKNTLLDLEKFGKERKEQERVSNHQKTLTQKVNMCKNKLFGFGTNSDPIDALENLLELIHSTSDFKIIQESKTLILYMIFHGYILIQQDTITPPESYQKSDPKKTSGSTEKRRQLYLQIMEHILTIDNIDQLVTLFAEGKGEPLAGILLAQTYSSGAFIDPKTGNIIERDTIKCNAILENLHTLCKNKEPTAQKYQHTIELLTYLHEFQHSTNFEKKSEAHQRLNVLEITPDFICMDLIPHTQYPFSKKLLFQEITESIVSNAQKLKPSGIGRDSALLPYVPYIQPEKEPVIADMIGALFTEIRNIEKELRDKNQLDNLIEQVNKVKGNLSEEGRAYLSNLLWAKTSTECENPDLECTSFTP